MGRESEQTCNGVIIRPHWLAMVQDILREYAPGREVRAFGSRVEGGNRPFSDLDIAICGTEPLDDQDLFRLCAALEESDLPINVDVVPLHRAGPHIIAAVARRSVVIRSGTSVLPADGTPTTQEK